MKKNTSSAQVATKILTSSTPRPFLQLPQVTHQYIDLPKTTLHCIRCGDGPPLIIVPATVSKIENWLALAQFMGQRFTVHFFELPGHGESTPFKEPFSSALTAETVEALIDHLGYKTISLMGFSFGGILAVATLQRLKDRVDKMILLSPALSKRALKFSAAHLGLVRGAVGLLHRPGLRAGLLRLARGKLASEFVAGAMRRLGKVEKTIRIQDVFQKVNESTAEVLCYQIGEMLDFDLPATAAFSQTCYFAMSVRDPILDFDVTHAVVDRHFAQVHVQRFDFPYHQPPRRPTFEEMVQQYTELLDLICSASPDLKAKAIS